MFDGVEKVIYDVFYWFVEHDWLRKGKWLGRD